MYQTLFSYRHTLEHPHLNSSLLKLKCEIFVVLGIIMPPLTHYDHKDTIKYLPKHHKTKGLTPNQVNIFKALEKRYVHEGRTIDPSFLEGTNLYAEFATTPNGLLIFFFSIFFAPQTTQGDHLYIFFISVSVETKVPKPNPSVPLKISFDHITKNNLDIQIINQRAIKN